MKVWDLDREYDQLLAFIVGGRERKRSNVRAAVEEVRSRLLAEGEKAVTEFSMRWDGWTKPYPLKVTKEEIESGASGG